MIFEEGTAFTPRFDADGLIVCVARAAGDHEILMIAYMNAEALRLTLATGEAHYWSRSRQSIWRKGATSGQIQKVREIRTDCDQDALLLTVEAGGDGGRLPHRATLVLLPPRRGGRGRRCAGIRSGRRLINLAKAAVQAFEPAYTQLGRRIGEVLRRNAIEKGLSRLCAVGPGRDPFALRAALSRAGLNRSRLLIIAQNFVVWPICLGDVPEWV